MRRAYVLDACALIAYFSDEPGANRVEKVLNDAEAGVCSLCMHRLNLLEVYYCAWRELGKAAADRLLSKATASPIEIIDHISHEIFMESARLKASYRVSLADAVALAVAKTRGARIVTSEHGEFDPVEKEEDIAFLWIR